MQRSDGGLGQGHALLDLSNGKTGVQTLGAGSRTVHDGVASVQTHGVLETGTAGSASLVTGVNHPSVGLHENSRAEVLSGVPPVRRARGRAAGAENAFVETIQLLTVLDGLEVFFAVSGDVVTLEVGLNGFVLLVELSQIGDKVSDDKHVGKGVDLGILGGVLVNAAKTGQGVSTVDIHGTRTTDTLTARTSES